MGDEHCSHQQWLLYTLGTLTAFTFSNFLFSLVGEFGSEPSFGGVSAAQVSLLIQGLVGLIGIALTDGRQAVRETGRVQLGLALAAGLFIGLGNICLPIGLSEDPRNKVIISSVLPLNTVFVAFAAWCYLSERLRWSSIAGIAVAMVGLILMGTAAADDPSYTGFAWGLGTMGFYAMGNFMMKLVHVRRFAITCVVLVGSGATGVVLFVVASAVNGEVLKGLWRVNDEDKDEGGGGGGGGGGGSADGGESVASHELLGYSIAAGLLVALGVMSLKVALRLGPAGPVLGIGNGHAIGVLILDRIFLPDTFELSDQKLAGVLVTLVGCIVLAFARPLPPPTAAENDYEVGGGIDGRPLATNAA